MKCALFTHLFPCGQGREITYILTVLSSETPSLPQLSAHRGLLYYSDVKDLGNYSVTYDERSFIINGTRTLLLGGSVHYPRSTPGMWDHILQMMVEDGLNVVEMYLFWNLHEFKRGQPYDLSGNANWTLFVEKAGNAGLFVNLRIGPYVCAEWDYGGLPLWLQSIPGMEVRADNEPWKDEMARFVQDMARLATPYLAKNGGPIIMAQIENEYHWPNWRYIIWVGELAASLNLGIPVIMCHGHSANNTINTCNGYDCSLYADTHAAIYPGQPLAWTENEGWFQSWNEQPFQGMADRLPEEISYSIMKWFARGGAYHNYYMWFGGNHMARWAAAGVTNRYAAGVNLHSDTMPNEPKKTHLQRLHLILADYSDMLLSSPIASIQSVLACSSTTGKDAGVRQLSAFIYRNESHGVVFIENESSSTTKACVTFNSQEYFLPANSSSMIDLSSGLEVFNSGKVNSTNLPTQRVYNTLIDNFNWFVWEDGAESFPGAFYSTEPLEQLNVTKDETDYLFYQTTVQAQTVGPLELSIRTSNAMSFLAFLDGEFQSTDYNARHGGGSNTHLTMPLDFSDTDPHRLTILSVSLGVHNWFMPTPAPVFVKGILTPVTLGSQDITDRQWLHRPKLNGEIQQVYSPAGVRNVSWSRSWQEYINQSLAWFRFTFSKPSVPDDHSLLLDLQGMGRGHIYLNGKDLGRFWLVQVNGVFVQRYYFIPPDLLLSDNLLVLLEELGAPAPQLVRLVTSTVVVPEDNFYYSDRIV